jgi:hypothetical protein
MSRRVLIALVVIVIVIVVGLVLTMKRAVKTGLARDAEVSEPAKPSPAR